MTQNKIRAMLRNWPGSLLTVVMADTLVATPTTAATPLQLSIDAQESGCPGGATFCFEVEVPGDHILVDHSINRVLKGAAGVLHVTGEAEPGVFDGGSTGGGGH